ncbi:hypothetical protein [Neolewinella persica]|uniref:hypothetical protein n=1 Tax=Neolewinella persica TaxID=70998 RepID=UPI0003635EA2|nr:hypothetical protein [Neolewinella persica]
MTAPTKFPWEPQLQEAVDTYRFDGRFVATATVDTDIGRAAVLEIYRITKQLVQQNNGINRILKFRHRETGEVVLMVDQLNDDAKASTTPELIEKYNTCTLCYPQER